MSTARWSIALASLVLLATIGVLFYGLAASRDPLRELVVAVGSDLAIEPRLSGGFLPRSDAAITRSATSLTAPLSPDARIAIARIEKAAMADRSPRLLDALGVAYLVQGDLDRAIATLEEATARADDPAPWSDLSAAYLVKARQTPAVSVEHFSRALESASRALRTGSTNEARFNRAMALEGLAPFVGETQPWADYLSGERDARWRAVANRHVSDSPTPAEARDTWESRRATLRAALDGPDTELVSDTVRVFPEASIEFFERELVIDWALGQTGRDAQRAAAAIRRARVLTAAVLAVTRDPMPARALASIERVARAASSSPEPEQLARAHLAYVDGISQYDGDDYTNALASFERALAGFELADSPYRTWALVQRATILFQQRRLDTADQQLEAAEQTARAQGFQTLLGRVLWLRGLVYSKQWRLVEALDAFHRSASCFEAASEPEYAASLYGHLADALRTLGEHRESWEYIGRTLQGLPRVRKPTRRYLFLYNAALFASTQDLLEAAFLFQNAAVREAGRVGAFAVAEALAERAALRLRRHDPDALPDAQAALARIQDIPDGPLKRYARAEVEVVMSNPAWAKYAQPRLDGMQAAIDFFSTAEPAMVPRLYLGLARARLANRSVEAAEEAFMRGIERLERQQSSLGDESLKISYFDESWNLFSEMVELQFHARQDAAKAFEYAERSRARSLLAAVGESSDDRPIGLAEVESHLPRSVALLYYATLPDRLLTWVVTSGQSRLHETPIDRAQLVRLITQYRAEVVGSRGGPSSSGDRLYDLLVRPGLGDLPDRATLVFVPDGDLQRVPFAALKDRTTARYVIESHPVLIAPSASLFAAGLSRLRRLPAGPFESALLVGDPGAGAVASDLAPLPGAGAEAAEASYFYPRREVLAGRAATKDRFLRLAPDYDVVHFGGHAQPNVEYPMWSRLSFAPNPDGVSQPLFAYESAVVRVRDRSPAFSADPARRAGGLQYRGRRRLARRRRRERRPAVSGRRRAGCCRQSVGRERSCDRPAVSGVSSLAVDNTRLHQVSTRGAVVAPEEPGSCVVESRKLGSVCRHGNSGSVERST